MTNSFGRTFWLFLGLSMLLSSVVRAQGGLTLAGLNTPSRLLSAADLAQLPRAAQEVPDKEGRSHRYEGVPLPQLLQLLNAPQGKAIHGAALKQLLLVTGADGYQVVFALPELDASFSTQTVLLADRRDGQPLPAGNGPYQLIVPQEKRPARWVKQVTSLRLVELNP